jgi:hypothetical protein
VAQEEPSNSKRTAEFARGRYSAIVSENVDVPRLVDLNLVDPDKLEQMRVAENQAQKELGDIYELIQAGEATTFDGLTKELEIQESLDAAVSRCLKRLLFVRGIKSISDTPLPTSRPKRLTDPPKVA